MLYPNLSAEQARRGDTNADAANYLGISRVTFESKCKTGRFTLNEAFRLCNRYSCDVEYLFSTEPIIQNEVASKNDRPGC